MRVRVPALASLVVVALLAPLVAVPLLTGVYGKARCAPVTAEQPTDQQADQRADDRPRRVVEGLDEEQLGHAAVIIDTAASVVDSGVDRAVDGSLSRQAAVIGVMTALTESSLRNLGHGDLAGPDSRGLFQQRNGWGPAQVRMDPTGAARLFFQALVAVPRWHAVPPWAAAQAVQRSAFPDGGNYAPNYPIARRVVAALTPAQAAETGARTVAGTGLRRGSHVSLVVGCASGSAWTAWGSDSQQHLDQLHQLHGVRRLPGAGPAVARAYALVGQRGYYQLCARLAANIWGRSHSGYPSAAAQWKAMVATGNAHRVDRDADGGVDGDGDGWRPPVGALLFWNTGGPYGHVAVYVGGGRIVSNDIGDTTAGEGGVYLVEVTTVEARWGATYLGWTPPIYTTTPHQ